MPDAERFRRIALAMTDAVEGAHGGHPDFRVHGRVFASLHADRMWGMVRLTPEQQQALVREQPGAFVPESGVWGRQGYTAVRLDAIGEEGLGVAMTLAWRNTTVKRSPHRSKSTRARERGSRPRTR